jgi:hypothetical protein
VFYPRQISAAASRPLALDLGPEGRPGFADGGLLFLHNHERMLDLLLGEEDVELFAKERP